MLTRRLFHRAAAALMLLAGPLLAAEPKPITIVVVGDSTVATYAGNKKAKAEQAGWGQVLGEFFTSAVTVKNHAKGGESTKSFLARGRWEAALADKPDWVLIQFGHNDQPGKGEERETRPETTYADNLRRYIADARKAGAKPVLVTSMSRRTWDRANPGRIASTLAPYVEAVKIVGAAEGVPVIDLHAPSIALYEKLGPEAAKALGPSDSDGTHFNTKGARMIAEMIVRQLRTVAPELKPYLK